jgi:hypothetical protein
MMTGSEDTEKPTRGPDLEWYRRARSMWESVFFPGRRFRNPWGDDELPADVARVREWLDANPCPDVLLKGHVDAMLAAYDEMAGATVQRVAELRQIIGEHAEAIDEWRR